MSYADIVRIEESELLYHSALSTVYDLDSFTKYGISRLPRELVNIILRELWNDRLTLQMCSLVCKSWLRECRTYLWQTTHITDAVYPTYGMYNRSNRIQAFTKFLAHTASLGFCSSIRILRVGGDEKVSEPHQRTRINVATIAALLEKLPHLQVMELTRVVLGHTVAKPKTQKFTLSTLSIHMVGCSVDEGSGIAEVLGLFDDIRTLEASYIDIPGALEPPSMALIPPNFQLNEVRLKGCLRGQDKPEVRRLSTVHRLLELLRNLPSTPRLRSITVQCGVMAEVRALGRCLQQAGRYVQNLGLEMYELTREHIGEYSSCPLCGRHLMQCASRSRVCRPSPASRRMYPPSDSAIVHLSELQRPAAKCYSYRMSILPHRFPTIEPSPARHHHGIQ